MSTYIYLVCDDHAEPVQAVEESGQHRYDVPTIRFNWLRREHWLAYIDRFPGTLTHEFDHLSYFERNTFAFLGQHRDCPRPPRIVADTGERFTIEAATIDDLLSEKGSWD